MEEVERELVRLRRERAAALGPGRGSGGGAGDGGAAGGRVRRWPRVGAERWRAGAGSRASCSGRARPGARRERRAGGLRAHAGGGGGGGYELPGGVLRA